jgi:hypothetical protein
VLKINQSSVIYGASINGVSNFPRQAVWTLGIGTLWVYSVLRAGFGEPIIGGFCLIIIILFSRPSATMSQHNL